MLSNACARRCPREIHGEGKEERRGSNACSSKSAPDRTPSISSRHISPSLTLAAAASEGLVRLGAEAVGICASTAERFDMVVWCGVWRGVWNGMKSLRQ
jgi:hypothetical protein